MVIFSSCVIAAWSDCKALNTVDRITSVLLVLVSVNSVKYFCDAAAMVRYEISKRYVQAFIFDSDWSC